MTQQTGPESAEPRAGNLTGPARQVHQAALAEFARTGQPPVRSKLERLARSLGASPDAVLAELAEADAIAFNDHGEIRAAYPFSPMRTPIRVSWPGRPAAYASCPFLSRTIRPRAPAGCLYALGGPASPRKRPRVGSTGRSRTRRRCRRARAGIPSAARSH